MSFVGGALAAWFSPGNGIRTQECLHSLIGFGGGILLAAVVFALLPEAQLRLDPLLLAFTFSAGGAFSGGGILYLIFEDIAPLSTMRNFWVPPLGAIMGFLVGMIGNLLLKG